MSFFYALLTIIDRMKNKVITEKIFDWYSPTPNSGVRMPGVAELAEWRQLGSSRFPPQLFTTLQNIQKYWKSVYNQCASLLSTQSDYNTTLLKYHNIYWDLTRSTNSAKYIWHLTFDMPQHFMTFDIWHRYDIWLWYDIWHWYAMTFDI